MKKLLNHVLIILIMLVILPIKLEASTFDVYSATSSTDTKDKSFGTYNEALTYMNNSSNRDLYIKRGSEILFAKFGIGYVSTSLSTIDVYSNATLTNKRTYLPGSPSTYGGDVAVLDYNYNTNALKIKISGEVGWVSKNYVIIEPLAKNPKLNYYTINTEITHILRNKSGSGIANLTLGPNDIGLSNGTYYSYDGNYFYNSRYQMLTDYKNNVTTNAKNKNAYYNYYMYLPVHSKTQHSPAELELFIYQKASVYAVPFSILKGESMSYFNGQELYGTNALISYSISRNESSNGRSYIALSRNNVYGHGSVDSNPGPASKGYISVSDSIFSMAHNWMNYDYASVYTSTYKGSHVGNKNSGINVRYASDPYWGEKAAATYYEFDKLHGSKDYNTFKLAKKKNSNTVYGRKHPSDSTRIKLAEKDYAYNHENTVVTIIGESIHNGVKYYKVISDFSLGSNHQYLSYTPTHRGANHYAWDTSYVYVDSREFDVINNVDITTLDDLILFDELTYNYTDFLIKEETVKFATTTKQITPYASSKLEMSIPNVGKLPKGRKVIVYQEAKDKSGNVVAYLISGRVGYTEKYWVSPSSLQFTSGKAVRVNMKTTKYQGVYVSTSTTETPHNPPYLYGTRIVPYVSEGTMKDESGNTKQGVRVDFDGQNKWVIREDSGAILQIMNVENQNMPPSIIASNKTIVIGNEFNPLTGVTATDKEDGNITDKITITSNNVNTNKAGTYNVTYSVTDNNDTTVTKTITVTVIEKPVVKSVNYFKYLKVVNNKLMLSGYNATTGYEMSDPTKINHTLRFTSLEEDNVYYDINIPVLTDKSKMDRPIFINDNKDYTYAWYEGEVNYNSVPQGNYILEIITESNLSITKTILSNGLYNAQINTYTNPENKTITSISNYGKDYGPVEVYIRDSNHLEKNTNSMYNKYSVLREMEFRNNKLRLYGAAYSYNVDYSDNIEVTQNLILENIITKEITQYNLSKGVELFKLQPPTKDNLSKKQSWFDSDIDLSNLDKGIYDIYIHTTTIKKDSSGNVQLTTKDFTTIRNGLYLTLPTMSVDNKTFEIVDDYISIKLKVS